MQELEYNPSKKDLTDAKIHHLLAEELCKPYRRVSCIDFSHPYNGELIFRVYTYAHNNAAFPFEVQQKFGLLPIYG